MIATYGNTETFDWTFSYAVSAAEHVPLWIPQGTIPWYGLMNAKRCAYSDVNGMKTPIDPPEFIFRFHVHDPDVMGVTGEERIYRPIRLYKIERGPGPAHSAEFWYNDVLSELKSQRIGSGSPDGFISCLHDAVESGRVDRAIAARCIFLCDALQEPASVLFPLAWQWLPNAIKCDGGPGCKHV